MLTKYGRVASSVYDLLGRNEVDLTAALGWALSQSDALLTALAAHIGSVTRLDPPKVLKTSDAHRSLLPGGPVPTLALVRPAHGGVMYAVHRRA
ncbi:hypothetical protein SAMN05421642_10832 [Rhodococcoides kyotonense]|uniref:Uncharacterized protein n=1 Tax=Rhodococcoides kyotonense TaxID=398843 RepID=A0A239J2R7_9NOCA|nr:hypothetical protein SAMN05421642_10832 [Rhodococcus kyotonensis]